MAAHVETGALVIALTGRWGIGRARALRRAVLRYTANRPSSVVVVDRAGPGRGASGRTVSALLPAVVVRRGDRWPGVPVLISAPAGVLTGLLRRLPGGSAALRASLGETLGRIRPHHPFPGVRRAHLRLAPTPGAAASARRLVRESCDRWRLPAAVEAGQLIVSELVANAVEHAGTEIDVTVCRHRRQLRIAVADRSPVLPDLGQRRTAGDALAGRNDGPDGVGPNGVGSVGEHTGLAVRGRGLALVARYMVRGGVLRGPDGKVVWAAVALPRVRRAPRPDRALRPLRGRLRLPDLPVDLGQILVS
ncbi:ATP-binding protein [Micromonospora sp. NPDC049559]|uniref:ATP-binding protein n=1 Tax=Micromonospora sp. NPDC049559 TaxID=3155923 RepID=UPI003440D86B